MNRLIIMACFLVAAAISCFAQEWAKGRLEKSPRHLEWIKVKHGDREVNCFIAYPEVKGKATTVLLIHEIFGLTDWVRGVADQLAEAGYIAIAPDLLSGTAPGGGGTAELGSDDAVRKAIASLPLPQVMTDLDAVAAYVGKLPAANGKVAVAGFCWGGARSFQYATANQALKAAFVFYGTGPDNEAEIARITCPVYGFYGGNDARVTTTVERTTELMKQAGKKYAPVVYNGAGHGFMRSGEAPDATQANKQAREQAWKRWLDELRGL